MHKPLVAVVLWTPLVLLSGCLLEGDRAAGRLSVHLQFRERQGAPEEIEWWLYDGSSGCLLLDTGREPADPQRVVVRFQNLSPGVYELVVQATDGGQLWQSGCTGLVLDRFEESYACEVERAPEGTVPMESNRCGDQDTLRPDAGPVQEGAANPGAG